MEAHTASQYRRYRELDDKKIKQHFQYHDTQANTMLNRIQDLENESLEDLGKFNKLKNEFLTEMNNAKKFLSKIQVNLEFHIVLMRNHLFLKTNLIKKQ